MALTDILKSDEVISCTPSDTIYDVARTMKDKDVGAIVVLEDNKPVGMITDRDLVVRCVSAGLDTSQMTAKDVMSSPVETIEAEGGIYDLIEHMATHKVRRVVLIDKNQEVKGLLSLGDMLELLTVELAKLVTATSEGRRKTITDKVA